jgi:hypothetical protein
MCAEMEMSTPYDKKRMALEGWKLEVRPFRASEKKIYPKIAPSFGPDARRFE